MLITLETSGDEVTLINSMAKAVELIKKEIYIGSGHVGNQFFEFQVESREWKDRYVVKLNGRLTLDNQNIKCDNFQQCREVLLGQFYSPQNFQSDKCQRWYSWSVWKNGEDVSQTYAQWVCAQED